MIAFAFTQTPDVLVDATGKLAAVKTAQGGYLVSTLRAKRFDQGVWLRRAGLIDAAGRWPLRGDGGDGGDGMRCDALGCILTVPRAPTSQVKVAFAFAPEALSEDCATAQAVVGLKGLGKTLGCDANLFISMDKLKRDGAHALYFTEQGIRVEYFTEQGIRVETVRELRGNRPWVVRRGGE